MRPFSWIILIAVCLCVPGLRAGEPNGSPGAGSLGAEIEALLVDLDSGEFTTRTLAFDRLQELAADQDARSTLAQSVERALVDPEISFEVRSRLQRIRRKLPTTALSPSPVVAVDEIDRLILQLADDSYARRLGTESRLRWLLGNADSVELIYDRVKHGAASERLSSLQTRSLERIYEEARAVWLADDRRDEDSAAPAGEIQRWVAELADVDDQPPFRLTGEPLAAVELRDLLAINGNVVPIRDALELRLNAGDLSAEAEQRLTALLGLTKPAMVAEYWQGGNHLNIQRLLVGTPSVSEGGTSHFDRVDDETAHCVTGVNLSEGDYPVGVAVPHPTHRTAFFHLVNLPTPRSRMGYEYQVKRDQAVRYAGIVQRTLGRYLARRIPIDERELTMIMHFDPRQVSRFAGQYLATVDDRMVALGEAESVAPGSLAPVARQGPSIHGLLCSWLASRGTSDAVPGLLTAIDRERVLAPSETAPYRFDRFAALALAQREPWPDVDRWLARMLPREEALIYGGSQAPELGATAAALLLRRHGGSPDEFELLVCTDVFTRRYGLDGFRYGSPDARQRVESWWKKQQAESATDPGPEKSPQE